jgi:hypothetical protein
LARRAQVIDRDRGAAALNDRMRLGGTVKVGIFGDKAGDVHEGGDEALTVAEVATIHEFGDPEQNIPRRSFLRDWADLYRKDHEDRLRAMGRQVIKGQELQTLLDQFGVVAVGEIQTRIANGIEPGLSEMRIKEKGSDVPLIDTGQLRSSVAHLAETRRGGGRG